MQMFNNYITTEGHMLTQFYRENTKTQILGKVDPPQN